jgi:hypothetical protein
MTHRKAALVRGLHAFEWRHWNRELIQQPAAVGLTKEGDELMMPTNEYVEVRNGGYYVAGTRIGLDVVVYDFRRGRSAAIFEAYPSLGPWPRFMEHHLYPGAPQKSRPI